MNVIHRETFAGNRSSKLTSKYKPKTELVRKDAMLGK